MGRSKRDVRDNNKELVDRNRDGGSVTAPVKTHGSLEGGRTPGLSKRS